MKNSNFKLYLIVFLFCIFSSIQAQNIIYVNATTGNDEADGTSWEQSLATLQKAFDISNPYDSIWVAKGIYYPTKNKDGNETEGQDATFILPALRVLFGGFNGNERVITERNIPENETILSGNIGNPNSLTDNCNQVIFNIDDYLDDRTFLDGFTIRDGRADDYPVAGGGIYLKNSSPSFHNCSFIRNTSSNVGGAIAMTNSNAQFINCQFKANQSTNSSGGAVYFSNSNPKFFNCLITGNRASKGGGGISNYNGTLEVIGCTIAGNAGGDAAGGIQVLGSTIGNIKNTIIWNNSSNTTGSLSNNFAGYVDNISVSYSLIHGTHYPGEGNLSGNGSDNNPFFIDEVSPHISPTTKGLYRVMSCSYTVDAGCNNGYNDFPDVDNDGDTNENFPYDIDFDQRKLGFDIDIGAYELQQDISHRKVSFIDLEAKGGNEDGSSWKNAFTNLYDAFDALDCTGSTEFWIAEGTYIPTKDRIGNDVSNEDATFVMRNNLTLYGGFSGNEYYLSERDFTVNQTIFSGDNRIDRIIENYNNGLNETAIVDGIIFENSYSSSSYRGGAIYNFQSHPTIRNCIFRNNTYTSYIVGGAAIHNNSSESKLYNCKFYNNDCPYGGTVYNLNSTTSFYNCEFFSNKSEHTGTVYNRDSDVIFSNSSFRGNDVYRGGAVYNISSKLTMANTEIVGNYSEDYGAAIYSVQAELYLHNCTVVNNKGDIGAILNNSYTSCFIYNSLLWNNYYPSGGHAYSSSIYNKGQSTSESHYSLIEGESNIDNGNLDATLPENQPMLLFDLLPNDIPSTTSNYALAKCSPLKNKGSNLWIYSDALSLNGVSRKMYNTTDIGAYEIPTKERISFKNIDNNFIERDTTFKVNVTIERKDGTCPAVINYTTMDGTASIEDNDYDYKFGELKFETGEVTKDIILTIHGNDTVEEDEYFFVQLSMEETSSMELIDTFFTVNIFNDDNASLDVDLLNFTVYSTPVANKIKIIWNADLTSEDKFTLQRSREGKYFRDLLNLSIKNHPIYFDENPYSGENYYRIQVRKENGDEYYSDIKKATLRTITNYQIYPNPVNKELQILFTEFHQVSQVRLYDVSGLIVKSAHIESKDKSIRLDVSHITTGIYFLELQNEQALKREKIIISH